MLNCSYCFDKIWQAARQLCCQDACQLAERLKNLDTVLETKIRCAILQQKVVHDIQTPPGPHRCSKENQSKTSLILNSRQI